MLANALEYAGKQGWHVFPVNPLNKRPLTDDGFKSATTDPDQISAWWQQWPYAMIGLATGKISGIVVLDVDIDQEKGIDGRLALAGHTSRERPLEATLCARTPRGGFHFYFHPDGREIASHAGRIGEGLDVRGEGGYIIVPPSMNGRRQEYKWITTGIVPIMPAPDWLIPAQAQPSAYKPYKTVLPSSGDAYFEAALTEEARAVATAAEGTRNDQLNRSAFALFRLVHECGADADFIHSVLLEAALHAGLPRGEAQVTLLSARRARQCR